MTKIICGDVLDDKYCNKTNIGLIMTKFNKNKVNKRLSKCQNHDRTENQTK